MPAYQIQRGEPQKLSQEEWQEAESRIAEEINSCTKVGSTYRNKMIKFLAKNKIWDLADIDYEVRCKYEESLKEDISDNARCNYMLGFDRIKLHFIDSQARTLSGRQNRRRYQNQQLFLPYHPEPDIAGKFLKSRNKEKLLWDFKRETSEILKKQIFKILHEILQGNDCMNIINQKLNALKALYDFCVEQEITDLEYIEAKQIEAFDRHCKMAEKKVGNILDISRKIIFLDSVQINWKANVWYMERFHFESTRVNPAAPVKAISFLKVTQKRNRKLLQQYMKYCLGTTNLTINNIRAEFDIVRSFLEKMQEYTQEDICVAEKVHIERYFHYLEKSEIQPATYNKKIISILHFFDYLKVRGYIEKIPFQEQYYLKKVVLKHHDRSVVHQVYVEIMQKLNCFPEDLRLMFLHQWTIGLRASEVCTLKGDAYYIQGRDAWIQVYQIKMKNYKRIPIPMVLYKLMKIYLDKYEIAPDEYIFKNARGGAYLYTTYKSRMLKYCKESNIANGEYMFQSHDYRHTLATFFYDQGISIQGIRDYLGHTYEEMTEQYIDFMPKKIRKANEAYFSKKENSLASGIEKRSRNGK